MSDQSQLTAVRGPHRSDALRITAETLQPFDLVTTEIVDDDVVVRLSGDLDTAAGPRLRDELCRLALLGGRHVTLDLAALTFIDSTGLSVIVGGLRRLRGSGGDLSLRAPSPWTKKVFEITGFDRIFAVDGDGWERTEGASG